jgi:hypothetical protein
LNVVLLLISLFGSYVIGRSTTSTSDVRPHAKKAFRRVVTHYRALAAVPALIESQRAMLAEQAARTDDDVVPMAFVQNALWVVDFQINQQLATVNDAMEDWRDIVPDEVEAVEREASESND